MTEMYIRFGEAPESGRSYNFETDSDEVGISCYRAEWQSTDRDAVCVYVPADTCIGTINEIQDPLAAAIREGRADRAEI